MRWQDTIIALCQTGFLFALIPSLRSRSKPAVFTSLMYVILLSIIATCLLTLDLLFSALPAYAGAIPWLLLAIQKIRIDRASK